MHEFVFDRLAPTDDPKGINADTFPFALLERLDHICFLLEKLADKKDDGPSKVAHSQLHANEADQSNHSEEV